MKCYYHFQKYLSIILHRKTKCETTFYFEPFSSALNPSHGFRWDVGGSIHRLLNSSHDVRIVHFLNVAYEFMVAYNVSSDDVMTSDDLTQPHYCFFLNVFIFYNI